MVHGRRTDRAERLLDLVSLFLAAKEPVTWAQLQEAFPGDYGGASSEAALRKWERDKAELVELGVPLTWVQGDDDLADGYLVDRREFYLPELDLAPDELALLGVAGAAALAQGSFPFRTDLAHALDKLLFATEAARLRPGEPGPRPVVQLPVAGAASAEVLEALGRAVAARKDVTFAYRSFGGEETTRRVSPYGLAYRRGAWFFVGHCHLRDAPRTFQVERVRSLSVSEAKPRHPDFDVPVGFSIRDHVAVEPWQYQVHPPVEVELRLDPEVALLAAPRFGQAARIERDGTGAAIVRLAATNGDAVVREVLSLSPHAELVAPAALRRRVCEAAERLAAAHGERA